MPGTELRALHELSGWCLGMAPKVLLRSHFCCYVRGLHGNLLIWERQKDLHYFDILRTIANKITFLIYTFVQLSILEMGWLLAWWRTSCALYETGRLHQGRLHFRGNNSSVVPEEIFFALWSFWFHSPSNSYALDVSMYLKMPCESLYSILQWHNNFMAFKHIFM